MFNLPGKDREDQNEPKQGRLISVTSPYGSTGKTLIASNLAIELAREKHRVLLVDCDFLGPAIANYFALSDLPQGLAGALRIAAQGRLDLDQLKRLSVQIPKTQLSILPTLGPVAHLEMSHLDLLIEVALENFDFVVLDQSALTNRGDDSANLQLHLCLKADLVFLAVLADPIGIFRLLSLQDQLKGFAIEPKLLVNRLRNSVLLQARKEISETLESFGTYPLCVFLPDDPSHVDQAVRDATPVSLGTRSGAFQHALAGFVRTEILGRKGRLDLRMAKLG